MFSTCLRTHICWRIVQSSHVVLLLDIALNGDTFPGGHEKVSRAFFALLRAIARIPIRMTGVLCFFCRIVRRIEGGIAVELQVLPTQHWTRVQADLNKTYHISWLGFFEPSFASEIMRTCADVVIWQYEKIRLPPVFGFDPSCREIQRKTFLGKNRSFLRVMISPVSRELKLISKRGKRIIGIPTCNICCKF